MDFVKKHRHLVTGIVVVTLAILGFSAYYRYSEVYPSTENAYVNAHLINIAPKLTGYIKRVYVQDNQKVKKDQLLLTIDPKDYRLSLTKALQDLNLAKEQLKVAQAQVNNITAKVDIAKANYKLATQVATRYTLLYKNKAGSRQDMEKYQTQAIEARESLAQAKTALSQAILQVSAGEMQVDLANTSLKNAQNNLSYTELRAPVDGYISNLNLQTGELVQAGQKLFGLVDDNTWWIDVNLKETQLKRIKPGQSASVELDMYDHQYTGYVQSIGYASGSTFALLPAENATGNWVKVTQRFTVRVALKNNLQYPLRVGASAKVTINTRQP